MIDRTEKPKIPSKFAKRDTNILAVILYETMSQLPTQTGNLLSQPMFLVSSLSILCETKKLLSVWRNNAGHCWSKS